jgi:2-polyprenyl-3-methyl-5-hydroxy-6-metoxy-1,4-benzoquinol methylase
MIEAMNQTLEQIACPYCSSDNYSQWATELSFRAVRCNSCAIIYMNPRLKLSSIDAAVRTGAHGDEAGGLNVKSRHQSAKVSRYRRIIGSMFDDKWRGGAQVSWLDIGAGYGEVVEAVTAVAPTGSRVQGLEPMKPKAEHARARGLAVTEAYLGPQHAGVDVVSVIDVFSHIPDFHAFLRDVKNVLNANGEILIETGNLADLANRSDFPGELGLPDHLVFAGEKHLRGYLDRAGFDVIRIEEFRIDGLGNLVKNIVKKIIGRPVTTSVPYTSKYRQLLVRAKLRNT